GALQCRLPSPPSVAKVGAMEVCMSRRRVVFAGLMLSLGVVCSAFAQQAPARPAPMRPTMFFREPWKSLPTPPDDHNAWPASQAGVSNPNLELKLYEIG